MDVPLKTPDLVRWERRLVLVLRLCGAMVGLALFAVPLPRAWMSAIHVQLGMGPLPEGPIVEYLARSLSAFYAIYGGLMWLVATDVRRYAPILTYLIWTGVAFGLAIIPIDAAAGLPLPWRCAEGTIILSLSAGLVALKRKARV